MQALSAGLKALGQRHGATLFMTLLAAWAIVLKRLSGQGEVVIGTPVANRARAELEPLIGFFVNTLALRLNGEGSPSVAQWLQHTKAQALAAQQHQDLPFEQVVELMRPVRSLAHGPLFQVMFAWEGQDTPLPRMPGLQIEAQELPQTMAKFDLTLTLRERGGCIQGSLGYATALYERETIKRHVEYLRCIARAMVDNEAQEIDRLDILPAAERHKLLVEWNDTAVEYPDNKCVHELFEAQAAMQPNAIAVKQGERQMSYGELNAKANQLAHRLRKLGVKPDERVAILVERSVEMVVALLATLKAGGAYVPLDPAYPAQRLAYMLEDCAPKAILTQAELWATLGAEMRRRADGAVPVIEVEVEGSDWAAESTANPSSQQVEVSPHQLAYVIYTSGSTGQPKGVMVEHDQLRNYVNAVSEVLDLPQSARYAMVSTFAADLGHTALFPALCNGGVLHIVSRQCAMSGPLLADYVEREGIDLLKIVPSHLEALLQSTDRPERLIPAKRLVLGGEPTSWSLVDRVRALKPGCTVINHYGPTETTVGVSTVRLSDVSDRLSEMPAIGRPLANVTLVVLGEQLDLKPISVAGELYVGGRQVSRGYLNSNQVTAQRFINNPFGKGRLYRTGDRARVLPDGTLQLLGRLDHQVKLRGFRIELGGD